MLMVYIYKHTYITNYTYFVCPYYCYYYCYILSKWKTLGIRKCLAAAPLPPYALWKLESCHCS
jgi:hypothetical protein